MATNTKTRKDKAARIIRRYINKHENQIVSLEAIKDYTNKKLKPNMTKGEMVKLLQHIVQRTHMVFTNKTYGTQYIFHKR